MSIKWTLNLNEVHFTKGKPVVTRIVSIATNTLSDSTIFNNIMYISRVDSIAAYLGTYSNE